MSKTRVSARSRRAVACIAIAGVITLGSALTAGANGPALADKLSHGPGVTNHPVHVRPTSAVHIPSDLPLDSDGTISCLTCHKELPSLASGGDPKLRGFNASTQDSEDFCAKCHSRGDNRTASGMHWMAVGRAHISDDDKSTAASGGSLDAESRRCMACHDGVTASEFANSTPWSDGPGSIGDRRRNHPVGVDYRPHGGKRRDSQMRAESLLPTQIRLPNGQVSCVSCHNLYSSDRYRLTVPVEGSKLCFACHAMD